MEFLMLSIIIFIASALTILINLNNKHKTSLPPGRLGLPLIGESMQLNSAFHSENPEPFVDERVRRYGRVFTTHVFGERTVFSVDADFNKALLGAEGRTIECSYPKSIATLQGTHSLLIMKGNRHKKLHSMTINRLASPAALRDSPLLLHIDRHVRKTMESWKNEGRVLVMEQAKKMTFELTVRQLMSVGPGEWTEGLRKEYVKVLDGFFAIPFPEFLSFTTYSKAVRARKRVTVELKQLIEKRKSERKMTGTEDDRTENSGEGRISQKDFLEELLEMQEKGDGMDEEEIVDLITSLLLAGYETTSTLMLFSVKNLTDHPHVLELLREEHEKIRAKKGENEALDWNDYKSMSYTQCVINETLRVTSIAGGIFRRAKTDLDYKGYKIPEGCKVILSVRGTHLDNEYYEDARTFNPSRWQKNDALQQASSTGIFVPFGGGPRLCPGYELARVVASIFLHYLVTFYSWEEAEKDSVVYMPTTGTIKGYPINVRCRKEVKVEE